MYAQLERRQKKFGKVGDACLNELKLSFTYRDKIIQFISVTFTSVRCMCTLPQPLAETGLYVREYPWCFCLCCWQSTEVDVTVRHYQCSLHACPGNKTLKRCTGRIISLTMLPWHLGNFYLISADLHSMSSAIKINKRLLKWMGPLKCTKPFNSDWMAVQLDTLGTVKHN